MYKKLKETFKKLRLAFDVFRSPYRLKIEIVEDKERGRSIALIYLYQIIKDEKKLQKKKVLQKAVQE
jgi:hypothetical protein